MAKDIEEKLISDEARQPISAEERLRAAGRAITSEEKRQVIERLFAAWEKVPALRLGQLLYNSAREGTFDRIGLFYTEDKDLCDSVETFLKKHGK